ncbi:MAG TPA: hypothetical protein VKX96_04970 [Chloroflexota bacterium]|nr:hypothetical protein [Chloroflexota bacterium]
MSDRPYPPSFTGLLLHREPRLGYSFFVPNGWYRQDVEGAEGVAVMYIPSPDDLLTGFSAEGRDLGLEVSADDFPALRAGFLSGLRKMNHSRIESHEGEAIGRLITLEARHTFRDGGATRKRWVRLLYQGTIQVRLVAQGSTEEEFNYWLPMFFESMRTFRFGDWGVDVGIPADDWLVGTEESPPSP